MYITNLKATLASFAEHGFTVQPDVVEVRLRKSICTKTIAAKWFPRMVPNAARM